MTTTQLIAPTPPDTGTECQTLLQQLTDKVTQLQGERKVLADLLTEAVDVLKTIEPESTDEAEKLAALIAYSEAAMAPQPPTLVPDALDFPDYHPV